MCIQPSNRKDAIQNWNVELCLSNLSSQDVDGGIITEVYDAIGKDKFKDLAKLIRKAKAKEFDIFIESIEYTTEMFED